VAPFPKSDVEGRYGVSRREFMTFCAGLAATLGLPGAAAADVASAITRAQRPSVIWLHHQECTGCTESLLAPSIRRSRS
jgi:hydrogenase small subunit